MLTTRVTPDVQDLLEKYTKERHPEFRILPPQVVLAVPCKTKEEYDALEMAVLHYDHRFLNMVDKSNGETVYFVLAMLEFLVDYPPNINFMIHMPHDLGADKFYAGYACKENVPWTDIPGNLEDIFTGLLRAVRTFTYIGLWDICPQEYLCMADPLRDTSFGAPPELPFFRTHFARLVGVEPKEELAANKLGFGYGKIAKPVIEEGLAPEKLAERLNLPPDALPVLGVMVAELRRFKEAKTAFRNDFGARKRQRHT